MCQNKLLFIYCLLCSTAFADNANLTPAKQPDIVYVTPRTYPPTQQYTLGIFNINGYIAGGYNYLTQSQFFTSGELSRQNDNNPNGFTLNQAAITIAHQPVQGFGGLINLLLG